MEKICIMPSVSVIIPFYSNKDWLREALESVYSQSLAPSEVIVVNDGSTEDIEDIISIYNEKIKYLRQKHAGPASARNAGIKTAKGDYIAFLDADDLWSDRKLELQLRAMLSLGCKWSYTAYSTFKDGKAQDTNTDEGDAVGIIHSLYPSLLCSYPVATPTVIVERASLLKTSLFNSRLRYGEDFCLWIELASKHRAAYLNNKLAYVRMRGNNVAGRAAIQLKVRRDIWLFLNDGFAEMLPLIISIPYKISVAAFKILDYFMRRINRPSIIELIARALYLFPWSLFKFLTLLYKRVSVSS